MKICEGCGLWFENPHNKKKRFCTQSCWVSHYNVTNPDGHNERGGIKGGDANRKLRGTSRGGNAYVKENRRHQHRVVAERELGRPLHPGETVHHEDLNRKNNDPANLIIFPSRSEHTRHHARKHLGLEECNCTCIRFKK